MWTPQRNLKVRFGWISDRYKTIYTEMTKKSFNEGRTKEIEPFAENEKGQKVKMIAGGQQRQEKKARVALGVGGASSWGVKGGGWTPND